jgi:hypothetical protein
MAHVPNVGQNDTLFLCAGEENMVVGGGGGRKIREKKKMTHLLPVGTVFAS